MFERARAGVTHGDGAARRDEQGRDGAERDGDRADGERGPEAGDEGGRRGVVAPAGEHGGEDGDAEDAPDLADRVAPDASAATAPMTTLATGAKKAAVPMPASTRAGASCP